MRLLTITTTIKYICSAMLVLLAVGSSGESGGLVAAYAELAAIFCISNLLLERWKKPGYIVGGILPLFFENYYNHTFTTYRGLSGQLFSGYQLQNYDENTLVSVQEA